jgi:HD-GYP domain-containing protein (c-di-GMP phosphodiesterase class II)
MQYAQVEISTLQVLPLRKVEQGMVIERPVYGRNDRVIAESGTEVNQRLLDRFQNHRVSQITVTAPQQQWVPADRIDAFNHSVEVLEKLEFESNVERIIDSLENNGTVTKIQNVAMYFKRKGRKNHDQSTQDRMQEIIDKVDELDGDIRELHDQLQDASDDETRTELLESLEETVTELSTVMLTSEAPQPFLDETIRLAQEQSNNNTLMEVMLENPSIARPSKEDRSFSEDDYEDVLETFQEEEIEDALNELLSQQLPEDLRESLKTIEDQLDREQRELDSLKEGLFDELHDEEEREKFENLLENREEGDWSALSKLDLPDEFRESLEELRDSAENTRSQLEQVLDQALPDEANVDVNTNQMFEDFPDSMAGNEPAGSDRASNNSATADDNTGQTDEGESDYSVFSSSMMKRLDEADPQTDQQKEEIQELKNTIQTIEDRHETLETVIRNQIDSNEVRSSTIKNLRNPIESDVSLDEYDLNEKLRTKINEHVQTRLETRQDLRALDDSFSGQSIVQSDDTANETDRRTVNTSGTQTSDSTDDDSDEKTSTEDAEAVAQEKNIPESAAEAMLDLYETPEDPAEDQQRFLKPIREMVTGLIIRGQSFKQNDFEALVHDSREFLAEANRPFRLFCQPPSGDQYLLSHGVNTFLASVLLGNHFDLSEQEIVDLTAAGISMDLGMGEIPKELWAESRDLTDDERQKVNQHPNHSESIVNEAVNGDVPISELALQHHERADGSGYPDKLSHREQHPLTPYLAVADSYTAMLEIRPYRDDIMPDRALIDLLKQDSKYDRDIVKGLVKEIGVYPNGTVVLLSNATLALVKEQNPAKPHRPNVFILTDKDRNRLDSPYLEDLSSSGTPNIERIVRR